MLEIWFWPPALVYDLGPSFLHFAMNTFKVRQMPAMSRGVFISGMATGIFRTFNYNFNTCIVTNFCQVMCMCVGSQKLRKATHAIRLLFLISTCRPDILPIRFTWNQPHTYKIWHEFSVHTKRFQRTATIFVSKLAPIEEIYAGTSVWGLGSVIVTSFK
jgi:hypothetical protein